MKKSKLTKILILETTGILSKTLQTVTATFCFFDLKSILVSPLLLEISLLKYMKRPYESKSM